MSAFKKAFLLIILTGSIFIFSLSLQAQVLEKLPDNILDGRTLFEKKHCTTCHIIGKIGKEGAPDLSRRDIGNSFGSLTAQIWNHFPSMDIRFTKLGIKWPQFTEKELVDLTAFLYFITYLGDMGDQDNGNALITSKGCLICHQVGEKGGAVGPKLDKLRKYISPLYLSTSMWNHMPQMEKAQKERGIKKPLLNGRDIDDLAAYIRKVSRETTRERAYLSPGNPKKGKDLFSQKGCVLCHTAGKRSKGNGQGVEGMDLKRNVTEIASLMWMYHTSGMMVVAGQKWPELLGQEMADLISYIYFVRFQDPPGNPVIGRRIFEDKKCVTCHSIYGKGGTVGPDLSKAKYSNESTMVAALLSHAPVMKDAILKEGIDWPYFSSKELGHLFAYLKSVQSRNNKK